MSVLLGLVNKGGMEMEILRSKMLIPSNTDSKKGPAILLELLKLRSLRKWSEKKSESSQPLKLNHLLARFLKSKSGSLILLITSVALLPLCALLTRLLSLYLIKTPKRWNTAQGFTIQGDE